jgi:IclR family transcriptional regulator, acetate operon repressor
MSVVEIERKVRLSRPTLYRLLETLAAHGMIRIHGNPQRFSLDYAIGRLARNWMAGLDVLAGPILEKLHERTRETVALATVRDHTHQYIIELVSPHVLSMSRGIGPMDHLTRGATGKVILAFMNEDDRNAIIESAPKGTDKKALEEALAAIRRNKFWVSRSEIFAGARGVAAPYFDHSNRVVGAIIVYGPEVRFSEARIAEITKLVVAAAEALSVALGQSRRKGD